MNIDIYRNGQKDYKAMIAFKTKLILKEYFEKVDYLCVNGHWPKDTIADDGMLKS